MIRTIKIFILLIAVVLLAWLLPWLYDFAFASSQRHAFTLYSCINDRFLSLELDRNNNITYRDVDGNTYSDKEFDSLLPTFYYRQLAMDGVFPDSIRGVPVSTQLIARTNFRFRSSPSDVNVRKPRLYPLLESRSGRVDLEMPGDVFRLADRIEFIDIRTNTVEREKSERFDRVFTDKGFSWPAVDVAGNPTVMKEYDEGYLLVDSGNKVYHLKMIAGRPYLRETGISGELGITKTFITEFQNRSMYGFLSDGQGGFYGLEAPSYGLRKLPFGFFPQSQSLTISGDMFTWTVKVSDARAEKLYAIDANDYSLVDYYEYPEVETAADKVAGYIFPFRISFTSYQDKFVKPRIDSFSWQALILNVLLACLYMIIRRRSAGRHIWQAAAVIPLGIFLFVPLVIMDNRG